ncbi:MAG: HD-GYP domain-containing protein [Burkholderiaceae bacterium]
MASTDSVSTRSPSGPERGAGTPTRAPASAGGQRATHGRGSPADVLAASVAPRKRFRITAQRLTLGMFVAELDRPWIDTPFLLQGFLLDSEVELETLRKYCRYAFVDLELSDPGAANRIHEAELLSQLDIREQEKKDFRSLGSGGDVAGTPKSAGTASRVVQTLKMRSDAKVSQSTRERFRELIRNQNGGQTIRGAEAAGGWRRLIDGLASLFSRGPRDAEIEKADRIARKRLEASLLKELPPGTRLTPYPEQRAVVEEMPRARRSLDRSEQTLADLAQVVKSGGVPNIADVKQAVDDMVSSIIDNPDALMWVARLRNEDTSTYTHGVRVALYMISLGRHLGLPRSEMASLGMIGMLADVGKIKIPRPLLEKPGMLNPAEYAIVKEHVRLGLESLNQRETLPDDVRQGIAQHHERLDGSGYPEGLAGDAICLYGRIAGIADCFSALITSRPYANAQAPQDALMNLYQWAGTWFNEALVENFVQSIGVFPVGSLVELSNGEIAVVVAQNRVRRLEPKVLVLTSPDKRPLAKPLERDLFQDGRDKEGKRQRITRGLPTGAYGLKMRDFYADNIAHANRLV